MAEVMGNMRLQTDWDMLDKIVDTLQDLVDLTAAGPRERDKYDLLAWMKGKVRTSKIGKPSVQFPFPPGAVDQQTERGQSCLQTK